jgi:serine/threonine-protein kinase
MVDRTSLATERRSLSPWGFGACAFLSVSLARAESSVGTKAAAEALFQTGVDLTQKGRVAEACTKFDASYQIDPALGTLFRLADCYDRIGRTASAWALFSEAKARAQSAEQPTREAIAAERVQDLDSRLSRLGLNLGANAFLPGLEVRLNDVLVPQASWGIALPVDPGEQRVRLTAPGREAWVGAVSVESGPSLRRIDVPELARLRPIVTPPPPARVLSEAHSPANPPRWLGYSIGGAGLLGIGVAGVLGYRAYSLNQQSLDECSSQNANACTHRGRLLRDDAERAATASTLLAVAGGALLAGGITLTLLSRPSDQRSVASLWFDTSLSGDGARAHLEGTF